MTRDKEYKSRLTKGKDRRGHPESFKRQVTAPVQSSWLSHQGKVPPSSGENEITAFGKVGVLIRPMVYKAASDGFSMGMLSCACFGKIWVLWTYGGLSNGRDGSTICAKQQQLSENGAPRSSLRHQ